VELFARGDGEVFSVTRLTQEIKERLERNFSSVRVEGEISNFRVPASGHFYFTLKDESCQIRVVMFRSRSQALPFFPQDGLQVTVRGGVTVYAPRGDYQLIAEWMEPRGRGNLQQAFEALKRRLAAEGLFDADRKRPLPYLPACVGLITSPTGAAIRDILKVLWRRFPNVPVLLCPVRVQGERAAPEIVEALEVLNQDGRADVILMGRGGGSLEDLWAFNEEAVARAVAASRIPVVSAVGHEIDFSISDFVADLRAPTPSAAAELVMPEKAALGLQIGRLRARLAGAGRTAIARRREPLRHLSRRLRHPGRRVQQGFLRLDDLSERLAAAQRRAARDRRSRLEGARGTLWRLRPTRQRVEGAARLEALRGALCRCALHALERKRRRVGESGARLRSLSPMGVLSRGYSITRQVPSGGIVRDAGAASPGDRVDVLLARGRLLCRVEGTRVERTEDT